MGLAGLRLGILNIALLLGGITPVPEVPPYSHLNSTGKEFGLIPCKTTKAGSDEQISEIVTAT
jgi:hypothetical protein